MRKTSEILRLKHEVGLTNRQIARSCGLTHPTVSRYLARAEKAGLTWPLAEDVDEEQLQALLFPAADDDSPPSRPLLPAWSAHRKGASHCSHASASSKWCEHLGASSAAT